MSDIALAMQKIDQLQARLATVIAPLSVTVPVVSGAPAAGQVLSCARGVWDHAPPAATYAYQWKSAATNVGTNVPTYTPVVGDITKAITCVVSATNTFGTTTATSNIVTILS